MHGTPLAVGLAGGQEVRSAIYSWYWTAAQRGTGAGHDGTSSVMAVCTAANSVPGSVILLSRLALRPGGQ